MQNESAIGTACLPFCPCLTLKLELPLWCCSALGCLWERTLVDPALCCGVKARLEERMCAFLPFFFFTLLEPCLEPLFIILHVISRIMFLLSFIFRIGPWTSCCCFITMNDFHSDTSKQGFSTSALLTCLAQIILQPCALWDIYLAAFLDSNCQCPPRLEQFKVLQRENSSQLRPLLSSNWQLFFTG